MSKLKAADGALFTPRDYQADALNALEENYRRDLNRQLVFLATGLGKGGKLDDIVLTPDGWAKYGDLELGDTVYDQDGQPTKVVGIYPQPELPEWKVTFNDGTEIYTTPQHEWTVRAKWDAYRARKDGRPRWRTLETQQMEGDESKWQVPNVNGVQHPKRDLPIDPYILGVLLAEGSVGYSQCSFTTGDPEIADEVERRLPEGYRMGDRSRPITYSIVGGFHNLLKEVGLYGKVSYDKEIDERYLYASPEQRLDLLRGLMDGDGTVSKEGVGHFSSASKKLAKGVCQLARSFGARTRVRKNKSSLYGKEMAPRYRVRVNLDVVPFLLKRKAQKYNTECAQGKSLIIRSTEPTGRTIKTRCIEVDSPHSTYVTRNYKVTHNSSGVMLHLPQRFPEHVRKHGFLFLAHRRKILFQAYEKFKAAYPNLWVGLEMGEHEAVGMEDAIFMSVDSVGREYQMRIQKYKNRDFGVIVADEGHHVTKESTWDRIMNYFGVGSNPSERRIEVGGSMAKPLSVFLTATPNRADEHSLAPFVDVVAAKMSIIDGIKGGWLTDIKAHQAYPKGESRIPEGQEIAYLVKTFEEYLEGHRTLVFARNVDESESLAYHLNEHDIARAAHIDHLTPDEERQRIYKGFEDQDGRIDALCNRLVLTEGYDNRWITAILDNAPTDRKPLHIQKIGRGLRPHPSANVDAYDTAEERRAAIRASTKPYLTYVSTFDPTKHGLDVAAELIGLDQPIDAEGSLIVEEVVDVVEEFEADLEEIPLEDYGSISELEVALRGANLFTQTVNNDEVKALTDLCWVNRGDSMHLFLPENPFANGTYSTAPTVVTFRKTPNGIERETVTGGWNGTRPLSKRRYETQVDAPTLNKAVRQFDSQLRRRDSEIYKRVTRGGSQPASDRMKTYLDNKGVSYTGMLSEEAALLMIADCKIKQWRDENE